MSAPTPSTYAALRTEAIAAQVTNPGFTAAEYALFFVAALALFVIGLTA